MAKVLAVLAALWLLAAPAWAGIAVTVNAEATVAGPFITLGELATIGGDDAERVKALGAVRLGSAPSPGHKAVLTGEMLGTRLAATGLDLGGVTWQVPPSVVVTTAAQNVGGDRLQAAALEAVRRQLGVAEGDDEVTISPLGMTADCAAPLGRLELKAEVPGGVRYNAPTTAVVTVAVDGRAFTNISVRFNVKAYQQVVVAARNIAAREEITFDALRSERREVGRISGYITDAAKVVGLTARRPIMAGAPLTEAAVDKPLVMKRGTAVAIVVKMGDMAVTAGGVAMQDGREGEVIRVQNVSSQRTVTARVVDANTVQVIIYGGR